MDDEVASKRDTTIRRSGIPATTIDVARDPCNRGGGGPTPCVHPRVRMVRNGPGSRDTAFRGPRPGRHAPAVADTTGGGGGGHREDGGPDIGAPGPTGRHRSGPRPPVGRPGLDGRRGRRGRTRPRGRVAGTAAPVGGVVRTGSGQELGSTGVRPRGHGDPGDPLAPPGPSRATLGPGDTPPGP